MRSNYFDSGQIAPAKQQSKCRYLAQTAAYSSEKHIRIFRSSRNKRSRLSNQVAGIIKRNRPLAHCRRKGQHKHYSSDDRRICKIVTQSSKKLLCNNYSNKCAYCRHPIRKRDRQIERKQHSSNGSRNVPPYCWDVSL